MHDSMWQYARQYVAICMTVCGNTQDSMWPYARQYVAIRMTLCGNIYDSMWQYAWQHEAMWGNGCTRSLLTQRWVNRMVLDAKHKEINNAQSTAQITSGQKQLWKHCDKYWPQTELAKSLSFSSQSLLEGTPETQNGKPLTFCRFDPSSSRHLQNLCSPPLDLHASCHNNHLMAGTVAQQTSLWHALLHNKHLQAVAMATALCLGLLHSKHFHYAAMTTALWCASLRSEHHHAVTMWEWMVVAFSLLERILVECLTIHSPPVLVLYFFLKWRSAHVNLFHSLRQDQSILAHQAETTVVECFLMSCTWARFEIGSHTTPGQWQSVYFNFNGSRVYAC